MGQGRPSKNFRIQMTPTTWNVDSNKLKIHSICKIKVHPTQVLRSHDSHMTHFSANNLFSSSPSYLATSIATSSSELAGRWVGSICNNALSAVSLNWGEGSRRLDVRIGTTSPWTNEARDMNASKHGFCINR